MDDEMAGFVVGFALVFVVAVFVVVFFVRRARKSKKGAGK